jgi:putative peptidoglycan lipid II flippase
MTTARIALAAAIMGVVTYVLTRGIGSPTGSGALVRLIVGVLVGVVVYGGCLLALRVEEVDALRRRFLGARSGEPTRQ